MRAFFAALLASACVVMLVRCTKVDTQQRADGRHPWTHAGLLRIGSSEEPDNLNPMFGHTAATDEIDALIFAPLFRYDQHGEFYPELATEVPTYGNGGVSSDGKTITVHFRKGVRWADGAPLDARDFRFTWRAVANTANNTKLRTGWDDIRSVDVPNHVTAVIRLRKPNANVLGLLATGGAAYPPLPEHLLAKLPNINRAPFNAQPLSSGPYLLKAWKHGASLEFVPNPRYWRGAPRLAAISWRIIPNSDTLFSQLQTHEIDVYPNVAENQIDRLARIDGITVRHRLIGNWRRLVINCSRPALSDVRVRRGLAEAVDWDRINATIYHGYNVRAVSDIMPNSWAAPRIPFYRYDPSDARALLDAAGFRMGSDGVRTNGPVRLAMTISSNTKPANVEAEEQIQAQLHDVGIDVSIKNYPTNLLFAQNGPLYSGHYDLEWSVDTNAPDPDNQNNWSGEFIPPQGTNTSFLRDPILTRTSEAALRTFDRAKRKALYQQEEQRIHELVPAVFLYWENAYSAYNSDLKGYKPAQYIADNWNAWDWSI